MSASVTGSISKSALSSKRGKSDDYPDYFSDPDDLERQQEKDGDDGDGKEAETRDRYASFNMSVAMEGERRQPLREDKPDSDMMLDAALKKVQGRIQAERVLLLACNEVNVMSQSIVWLYRL